MTRPKPWYRHVEDRLKVDLDRVSYKACIFRKEETAISRDCTHKMVWLFGRGVRTPYSPAGGIQWSYARRSLVRARAKEIQRPAFFIQHNRFGSLG